MQRKFSRAGEGVSVGYYSQWTSSTTYSNDCLWLFGVAQSESSVYHTAFMIFLYEEFTCKLDCFLDAPWKIVSRLLVWLENRRAFFDSRRVFSENEPHSLLYLFHWIVLDRLVYHAEEKNLTTYLQSLKDGKISPARPAWQVCRESVNNHVDDFT